MNGTSDKISFTDSFYKKLRASRKYFFWTIVLISTFKSILPILPIEANFNFLLGVIPLLLVFIILDAYREVNDKLDGISSELASKFPPVYQNFSEAQPRIYDLAEQRLKNNGSVLIQVLAVTSQFSWKFVEDHVPDLFKLVDEANNKMSINDISPVIEIEIAIVKADVLEDWGQKGGLAAKTKHTVSQFKDFKRNHKSRFENGTVSLKIFQYDNIPHWHGVLIDAQELFMGRCSWDNFSSEDKDKPLYKMRIGQREYRHFKENDGYKGEDRVALAKNWFELYKYRAIKLGNVLE